MLRFVFFVTERGLGSAFLDVLFLVDFGREGKGVTDLYIFLVVGWRGVAAVDFYDQFLAFLAALTRLLLAVGLRVVLHFAVCGASSHFVDEVRVYYDLSTALDARQFATAARNHLKLDGLASSVPPSIP